MLYTPTLVTLDAVRLHRSLAHDEDADDALLTLFVQQASDAFIQATRRVPMPYMATRVQDWNGPQWLELDEDLLEIVTLTNGDATTISLSDVQLQPQNAYPHWALRLKQTAGSRFVYANGDPYGAISVNGWWGYAPHYPSCWRTVLGVPAGGLTSSQTTITLTVGQASLFETLQYLKVSDEIMQVTARSLSSYTLTVERGVLGTTAVSHLAAVPMQAYTQRPDVAYAVIEMAAYLYKTKDQSGGRVQVFEGGVVTVEDLNPMVGQAIRRHQRQKVVVV